MGAYNSHMWKMLTGLAVLLAVATAAAAPDRISGDPVIEGVAPQAATPDSGVVAAHATEPTAQAGRSRFALYIERLRIGDGHLYDTIDVLLESNGHTMAGFDLKIAVASDLVEIADIIPGVIYDSCRWEFFHAGPVRDIESKADYPPVLWQIVALAEAVPDQVRPRCYGLDRTASLLRIVFAGASREILTDTAVPLFFFWEDCTDNTISGRTGDTMFVSAAIFDYIGDQLPESRGLFPTRRGTPQQCISPAQAGRILRELDLHNGGVRFRFAADTIR